MDILNQCRDWLHQGKYSSVIEVLENMSEIAMSLDLDLVLTEAYFGIANKWEDRPIFQKALQRLLAHKEEMSEDFWWNIRVGQAYFNTCNYGQSIVYYRKARLLRPHLSWVEAPLKECEEVITNPAFYEYFAERVETAWRAFEELEGALRGAIHGDMDIDKAREAFGKIDDTLEIACDDLDFSVAGEGKKAELILSPQGNWCRFFELFYLKERTPDSISKNWKIYVGRQPTHRMRIGVKDAELTANDVTVWLDEDFEGHFHLSVYCEKIAYLVDEDRDQYYWVMVDLIDNTIGELPRMRYFNSFDVLEEPKEPLPIDLPELPNLLEEKGFDLTLDPADYIHNYFPYFGIPKAENPENEIKSQLRSDIYEGNTNCAKLLKEYARGKDDLANNLFVDGAAPGFIFFTPPYDNEEENLKMLDEPQEYMVSKFIPTTLLITGTAKGLNFWYVDFIAWSLPGAIEAAEVFFQKHPETLICGYQIFHSEAETVFLKGESQMAHLGLIAKSVQ